MIRGFLTAYNKVRKCIMTSESLAQLETSEKMITLLMNMYDPGIKFENRLKRTLFVREEELLDIINEEEIDE